MRGRSCKGLRCRKREEHGVRKKQFLGISACLLIKSGGFKYSLLKSNCLPFTREAGARRLFPWGGMVLKMEGGGERDTLLEKSSSSFSSTVCTITPFFSVKFLLLFGLIVVLHFFNFFLFISLCARPEDMRASKYLTKLFTSQTPHQFLYHFYTF